MNRTIEQQIAKAEAKLARLRNQSRQLENGQKIILGGMVLASARHDCPYSFLGHQGSGKAVTRDMDKKRLQPLLDELRAINANPKGPPVAAPETETADAKKSHPAELARQAA